MRKGQQGFGIFMARLNDLQRRYNDMSHKYDEAVRLLERSHDDMFHASHVLRLGGYTSASDKLNRTYLDVHDFFVGKGSK